MHLLLSAFLIIIQYIISAKLFNAGYTTFALISFIAVIILVLTIIYKVSTK